jgi:FKBP-type peptidyl-prolyl cis-trans isomerase FkpA
MKNVYALMVAASVAASVSFSLSAIAQDAAKTEAKPQVAPRVDASSTVLAPTPVPAPAEPAPLRLSTKDKLPTTVTQLITIDREPGDPKAATAATRNAVLMHYTGWLYDPSKPDGKGTQFDSSIGRTTPFGFIIGAGRVIKGWDQGVPGMKVKGKRTLVIPPHLGYAERGAGGKIPPNATLIFDVELVDIVN